MEPVVNDVHHVDCGPGEALGDSGCRSPVGGSEWHAMLQESMLAHGRVPREVNQKELFKFGAGP
eukprot:15065145-Heterocapsa_arctica.AAC.1